MQQKDLRTYQRRGVTRESGYHTCDETTGGECKIAYAQKYTCKNNSVTFVFNRTRLELVELFEKGIGIIAFGGYIYSEKKATISLDLDYSYEGQGYAYGEEWETAVEAENWANIGAHIEQIINLENDVIDVTFKMKIACPVGNTLHFIGFDFDVVSKPEFLDTSCAISFYQKTSMHVPYLYYLSSELPIETYLVSKQSFEPGKRVVLKSCNRCGRYLPINIDDELKTLSFSLHCKKRAPCSHSTFRAYDIQNRAKLKPSDLRGLRLEENKVVFLFHIKEYFISRFELLRLPAT